jgi:AraC-like DNA-binding protein
MADSGGSGLLYYKEVFPSEALRPVIYCFWELRTTGLLENPLSYRVVADGCIDMIIDTQSYHDMFIAGIADASFDVPLSGHSAYFGIRFLPGTIHSLFPVPVNDIRNLMVPAADVLEKEQAELSKRVFEAPGFAGRIAAAEQFLIKRISKQHKAMHPGLACALHHILYTGGNLPIQKKAADWISPRQLRRLFQEAIGCHPKLFARIVRFQKTLSTLHGRQDFYHYGYFDQAHFIKDFKTFSGTTPSLFDRKLTKVEASELPRTCATALALAHAVGRTNHRKET